jgi:hypothetical protein
MSAETSRFLNELSDLMAAWLGDNTSRVFEEQPFVDTLRNEINAEIERLQEAQ